MGMRTIEGMGFEDISAERQYVEYMWKKQILPSLSCVEAQRVRVALVRHVMGASNRSEYDAVDQGRRAPKEDFRSFYNEIRDLLPFGEEGFRVAVREGLSYVGLICLLEFRGRHNGTYNDVAFAKDRADKEAGRKPSPLFPELKVTNAAAAA